MALRKEEINRKLLHILSGSLFPVGIFYLPRLPGQDWRLPAWILGGMLAVLAAAEILRMRVPAVQRLFMAVGGRAMRPSESGTVTGATWLYASAFVCSLVFMTRPDVSFMVLGTFILGDAVAALVGQSIGRVRIGPKSLEGSLACLALCLVMYLVVFPLVPMLLDNWGGRVPLLIALAASLLTTVMELFPIKTAKLEINDNLTVPLATGLLLWWLHGALHVQELN